MNMTEGQKISLNEFIEEIEGDGYSFKGVSQERKIEIVLDLLKIVEKRHIDEREKSNNYNEIIVSLYAYYDEVFELLTEFKIEKENQSKDPYVWRKAEAALIAKTGSFIRVRDKIF